MLLISPRWITALLSLLQEVITDFLYLHESGNLFADPPFSVS
jgi:hypothetical protein